MEVRAQDQDARLPRLPVQRRADRRPLPNLADRFTGTKRKWFTFTNGLHINSLDPETFNRWFDFLELYVAQRRPELSPLAAATASVVYATAMGVPGVTLPDDPIRDQPSLETAKAAFESQPRVQVLFDAGAGGPPNHPVPGFEQSFKSLPIPGTKARSWFLGDGGTLLNKAPKKGGSDTFVWDKESRPADDFTGTNTTSGDLWTADPSFDWKQPPAGRSASYVSPRSAPTRRSSGPAPCAPGSGPRSPTWTCR